VNLELLLADVEQFKLKQGADSITPYKVPSFALKELVEGLPVMDGVGCTLCTFYTPNLHSLSTHLHNSHRSQSKTGVGYRTCSVQRLSKSPGNHSWFEVNTPIHNPTQKASRNCLFEIVARDAME